MAQSEMKATWSQLECIRVDEMNQAQGTIEKCSSKHSISIVNPAECALGSSRAIPVEEDPVIPRFYTFPFSSRSIVVDTTTNSSRMGLEVSTTPRPQTDRVDSVEEDCPVDNSLEAFWNDIQASLITKEKKCWCPRSMHQIAVIIVILVLATIVAYPIYITMHSNFSEETSFLPQDKANHTYRVVCDFLSVSSVSACQEIADFDTRMMGDIVAGSTIPTEIGLLTQLTFLRLFEDGLSGTLPSEVGLLTQLSVLFIVNNSLTGTIPSQLGQLSQLTFLNLGMNHFNGTIPESLLINMTNLEGLSLSSNALTGSIPTSLSLLTKLTWLSFVDMEVTGSIPSELCSSVSPNVDCREIDCICCQGFDYSGTFGKC